MDARQKAAQKQFLTRRNLYVLPSQAGCWFLVLDVILWLVGTNYQNNLILALAFLLITLFVVSILHTFANLAGLAVQVAGASPVFVGENAEFKLLINKRGKRARDNLRFYWQRHGIAGPPTTLSLIETDEASISVFLPVTARGWFDPGRLFVETYYPLGLIRCWTRLAMDFSVLAYPKPEQAGPLPDAENFRDEGEESNQRGNDEFAGHREYQAGDSLRTVSWQHYARGIGVFTKQFSANVDHRLWLEWDALAGMHREARLSRLCYWALEAHKADQEFGLHLPGLEIQPARGAGHLQNVLRALALFEVDSHGAGQQP